MRRWALVMTLLFCLLGHLPASWALSLSGGGGGLPTVSCPDTGGNHLNFSGGVWSCGTSSSGGVPGNAFADGITKGVATFVPADFSDNGSGLISLGPTIGSKTLANTNTFLARDDRFTLQDDADVTRQARFQLSGITSGQTRLLTLPNADGTLATLTGIEVFTGKTLSGLTNTFSNIPETALVFSDVLTGNATTLAHGFLPKLPGGTTLFLRGDGTFAAPPGSGDASTNTSTSVNNELTVFVGTTGKLLGRATTTGLLKATTGVLSAAVAGTDYVVPGNIAPADAQYFTARAETGLSAEVNLGLLTTGLLKLAVSGGIATPSTAIAGTDYQAPLGFTAVPDTRTISTTAPLAGGGNLTANRTLSIADAAADGTTKGAATFTANDFNATTGVIALDYTNAQAASSTLKGFLTAADWTTFNAKVSATLTIGTTAPLAGGGDLSANRTLTCPTCTTSAAALTSGLPVIGQGGQALAVGTKSGTTTEFATSTGAKTTGKQLAFDASGNVFASAADIGAGTGGGISGATVNAPLYAISATTATSTAALTNGQLLIGSTGVPPVPATLTSPANHLTITPGAGSLSLALASSPVIASFANAVHTHVSAAQGGTLTEAALVFSDVVTGNATTVAHGFLPKLPGGTTTFLRGDGTFATPTGSGITGATVNAPLYAASATTATSTAALTNGQLLIGSTGAPPVPAALTSPANHLTITPGAGSLSLALASSPVIASFTNAVHTHTTAAGGGTLAEAALVFSDVVTGNATTLAHGFLPKLPGGTTTFLRGDGTFAAPPGGSGGVAISGSPVANQVAIWTDPSTITGTSTLSFNITDLDLATATRTRPNKVGTTPPATCAVGDTFFDTDAPSGSKITGCESAPSGWVPQGGGGGSVDISGFPVADQFAVWVDNNTLTGTNAISFNITDLDVATATRTRPNKVGTSPPATCEVGDTFFDSDASAGTNLFGCTAAPSTWTLLGGAGSSSFSTPVTITTASTQALAVGPAGTTNPTLRINTATASAVTGLEVLGAAAGGRVTLAALSSATDEGLTLQPKGAGTLRLDTGAGSIQLRPGMAAVLTLGPTTSNLTLGARNTVGTTAMIFAGGTDTLLPAGTEVHDILFDLGQTKQHAGSTTIALQRHVRMVPPTDTCQTATCTVTEAYLLSLSGPPSGGTNSVITTTGALHVGPRALSNVINGYGLVVDAPTGASTLNAAAYFRSGPVLIADLTTAVAAVGTRVVCAAPADGRLFLSATASDCAGVGGGGGLPDPGANGLVVRTSATPTTASRTLIGTAPVSVLDGDGVAGNPTISVGDSAADGTTKGVSTYAAADFNATAGVISLDYANGQAASSTLKGFLIAADWITFNAKVASTLTIATTAPLGGGGDLSANRTLTCITCTTNAAALVANQLVLGAGGQATATLGTAGTTTTVLHGNAAGPPTFAAVSLAADVSGILPGANGGTGNGFFAVTGPTTSLKTFTFPNASAAVLTTNAVVTVAQGGTGTGATLVGLLQGSASAFTAVTSTTTGQVLRVTGANTFAFGAVNLADSNAVTGTLPAGNLPAISLTTGVTGLLPIASGGTGTGTTLVGLLQGSASAFTAVTSTTTGQVLRVTAANTFAFGAVDLADPAAVTGILPAANLLPSVAYVSVTNAWQAGVKQTFAPNATTAGLNVGAFAGDPSTLANGDLWYDGAAHELTARINGVSVALGPGTGSGTVNTGTANSLAFYPAATAAVSPTTALTVGTTSITSLVYRSTAVSASRDLVSTDGPVIECTAAANVTLTLPPIAGTQGWFHIIKVDAGAGACIVESDPAERLNGAVGGTLNAVNQWEAVDVWVSNTATPNWHGIVSLTPSGIALTTAANAWAAGVKQTFAPNATTAGLNVGSFAGDPSTPANGDLWYDATANELNARINGTTVALGAGGGTISVQSDISDVSVTTATNPAAEAQLKQLSLPAGALNVAHLRTSYEALGRYTTASGQSPTMRFRLYLCTVSGCGSGTVVTLADFTTAATTAATTNSWFLEAVLGTAATGASGTLESRIVLRTQLGVAGGLTPEHRMDQNNAVSSAIDLTAALFLRLTVLNSTSNASNSVSQRMGVLAFPGGGVPASDTAAGVVELATTAETTTGTDATRAVTPAGLAGSSVVRSIYIPAGSMDVTGACAAVATAALVTNGPKLPTISCTDADADAIEFDWIMPDGWTAGTITVELAIFYTGTTHNTQTFDMNFSGQCVSTGDVVAAHAITSGATAESASNVQVVLTASGTANRELRATTPAITLAGSCVAGDHVYMHGLVDAGGTSFTPMNELKILGVKVEYTRLGGND